MTNEELFQALNQTRTLCLNSKKCSQCLFNKGDDDDGYCMLSDTPDNWNFEEYSLNNLYDISNQNSDNLFVWHDGYDTGYKVGKNDALLKVRDYINEMR